jgi:PmbA protein
LNSDAARDIINRALKSTKNAGATAVDTLLVSGDTLSARVRNTEIDFVTQAQERALGIRVLITGKGGTRTAVTSTSDLSHAAVHRMAEETVALARATEEDPHSGLPDGGFATDTPELGLFDPLDRNVEVESRIADARTAEAAARSVDSRIENSEGSQVSSDFAQLSFGNSMGFYGEYQTASHSLFSEPIARENGSLQRDYWMTLARRLGDLEAPDEVGRHAASRALRRLGATRVPTCEVPIIFDPKTASSLVGQIASCVNGYSVYRKTSFLADRLGDAIAVPSITIVDDGRRPAGLGSKPFDGEGLPTRRTTVVDSGKLTSFLLDSYSARKLELQSTGNAARGIGGPPSAAPTNLWLEPGTQTLDEIITSTERGLLVTELIGMGFNPVTGDYSRGAAGLWIEGGEIVHPVEEITIAGNFSEMLMDIDAVGSDILWLGRIASPSLRVAKMTVAGE